MRRILTSNHSPQAPSPVPQANHSFKSGLKIDLQKEKKHEERPLRTQILSEKPWKKIL